MKARLPKGYGGGPQNMNDMIKQAQKMQDQIEQKQAELALLTFEASAGGGAVKATVTGGKELASIAISPEVVDPEDVEILQDLVIAAVNEALRTAEEVTSREMEKITGGVSLPM